MEQERIKYIDVINLGFKEECCSDAGYFNQYGFEYSIITKQLTGKIYLDWEKETGFCKITRVDSKKTQNIQNSKPIKNLEQLKEIINFFCEKKKKETDSTNYPIYA